MNPSHTPMNGYRDVALTALRTTFLVALALIVILVLLPFLIAAQAAAS